eukprot:1446650-Pyramimonas_sp.AAC.1
MNTTTHTTKITKLDWDGRYVWVPKYTWETGGASHLVGTGFGARDKNEDYTVASARGQHKDICTVGGEFQARLYKK